MPKHFRWWSVLLAVALLLTSVTSVMAQEGPIDEPDQSGTVQAMSQTDLLEQMEAELEASDDFDTELGQYNEPLRVYSVVTLNRQMFLPLVSSSGSSTVEAAAEEALPSPLMLGEDELTTEQRADLQASQEEADAFVQDLYQRLVSESVTNNEVSAASTNATTSIVRASAAVSGISGSSTHKEAQDFRHRNFCGPAAIRVAIDATVPKSYLPSQDQIAISLETDPRYAFTDSNGTYWPGFNEGSGVTGYGMCKYLHGYYVNVIRFPERYLAAPKYGQTKSGLWSELVRHVERNYTIPTGTNTSYLADWSRPNVPHVNAVMGYDADLQNGIYPVRMYTVRYAETAGRYHGYNGDDFRFWYNADRFWGAVSRNNVQCVLKAGI